MDDAIRVGDYVVTEKREVGQVTEISRLSLNMKVLSSFPPREGFCRLDKVRKCYPAPLRKFREGDVVIRRDYAGEWTVVEDEGATLLVCVKEGNTGELKAVTPSTLLLIKPIDLRPRFEVRNGVLWDRIEDKSLHLCPSWEGTTRITHLCHIMNNLDKAETKKLDK